MKPPLLYRERKIEQHGDKYRVWVGKRVSVPSLPEAHTLIDRFLEQKKTTQTISQDTLAQKVHLASSEQRRAIEGLLSY